MTYNKKTGNVYVDIGGLKVECEILDYKNSYGKHRYLIRPVAGTGRIWKEL